MTNHRSRPTVRGTLHAAVTLCVWWLFGYWWGEVLPGTSARDAVGAFLLIALTAVATTFLTLVWVRHNVAIFRRKGPRKGLPPVSEERSVDSLGRALDHPGYDSLKAARSLVVSRVGDRKRISVSGSG